MDDAVQWMVTCGENFVRRQAWPHEITRVFISLAGEIKLWLTFSLQFGEFLARNRLQVTNFVRVADREINLGPGVGSNRRSQIKAGNLMVCLRLIGKNYSNAKALGLLKYDAEVLSGDSLELVNDEVALSRFFLLSLS